ncbi:MAG: hypothetical protein IT210_05105 [Armatimonadetes bacterium]|nr:hypothetical protein [Armatimonadota bacterium]
MYRVNAPLPGLPAPLEGFTICQMTDLHQGPLVTEAHIRRTSGMAMSLNPDMIVLTGNFVQNSARFARKLR